MALLAPIGVQLAHLLVSDLIWIALLLLSVSALSGEAAPAAAHVPRRARAARLTAGGGAASNGHAARPVGSPASGASCYAARPGFREGIGR